MIIEFIEGEMIVTHPTGVVDEYDVSELESIKARELVTLACCQTNCDCIDDYIANAEASVGEPEIPT